MTIGENKTTYDTSTDIRRLLDAGYEVSFQRWSAGPGGEYFANIAGAFGSRWKGLGETPGEALRSVWPLGYDPGQGGCGHCGGLGCEARGCPVCAAYTDQPGTGVCAVCGAGEPDSDPEDDQDPYCAVCGADAGIFHGHGGGWYHWRAGDDGRTEVYDAGHAVVLAWRTIGDGGEATS